VVVPVCGLPAEDESGHDDTGSPSERPVIASAFHHPWMPAMSVGENAEFAIVTPLVVADVEPTALVAVTVHVRVVATSASTGV